MMSDITQSYLSGPQTVPLLNQTIGAALAQTVANSPDHDALISCHQDVRWTYRQYQHEVDNFACGLLAIGIRPGDRVGIWAPNCFEWCVTQFATAKIGAIMVCINPAYRLHELEYALNKVQCKAIVCAPRFKTSEYLQMLYAIAPELKHCRPGELNAEKLPHLSTVIRMGDELSPGMFNYSDIACKGCAKEAELLKQTALGLSPNDPINIQFTSGTTGQPKGATLTHHNILNNGKVVGDGMQLTAKDRLCIPVPLYHCFGMVMGNLACVTHGSTVVLPNDAFDPLITLKTVAEERCTALHGVPTMFIAELDHPRFSEFDLSCLRTGIMAGSSCPVEVMKRVINDMHMEQVLIAYGQTETSPVNHMTAIDDPIEKRVSTVGKPGPHLDIKLVDESGALVPIGEKGEICCKGYSVMCHYWDDDEKTRETIDQQQWLHSGDLGVMDGEGYVEIVGRLKDMVIRGGENIYPREVEEFLYTHPMIQEVQIFGIKDEKLGEQLCAWIKTIEGAVITHDDVRSFCQNQISHFKIPHYIRFVEEYPMTVTGKIQKFKMREDMERELDLSFLKK
jgi:fatty-acyl-CoA synthase